MPTSSQFPRKYVKDWLFNATNSADFVDTMTTAIERIQQQLKDCQQPFNPATVNELRQKIRAIDLSQPRKNLHDVLDELQDLYMDNAVYFHHEKYMAHLNCPVTIVSIIADTLATSINTSVDTWDQSAGATLIEQQMIDWAADLCGFDDDADGVFTSGGTQSNLLGVMLARDCYTENQVHGHNTKMQGLPACASRYVIFCSELSHFSIEKAAALCGLGYEAVIKVRVTADHKLCSNALTEAITDARAAGKLPIAIIATAGTTDFGSIDPLLDIASIARQNGLWLHVDAAYGCGLLASDKRRQLLDGLQFADSVTLDFHKSFFQPVSCSAFLIRHRQHFKYITYHADYLNPLSQTEAGTPNLVNKSLQTSRRFDALKLWMTLRVIGQSAIGDAFDHVCTIAKEAEHYLYQQADFEVLPTGDLSTVVFRFVSDATRLPEQTLNDCNYNSRQQIIACGQAMIAATIYKGRQYLKMTILNPCTSMSDIAEVCLLIRQTAQAFLQQHHLLETVA